jgi:molybdopterin synthase sulfur carrier subunit
MVTLLYFASLREAVGVSREQVSLPSGSSTVSAVVEELRQRDARWTEAFAPDKTWRVAVNQQMANASTPVRAGDEVAFFPPVTGG